MRIKPRNKKEKNEWLYTARGLKVTCVVTTREGRSVKFAEIGELIALPGALSMVKAASFERSLVTIDFNQMKMRSVAI